MQRKAAPKVGRKQKCLKNQLSVDCLDPDIGYTKEKYCIFVVGHLTIEKNAVKNKRTVI
jgi:hypothetical protein